MTRSRTLLFSALIAAAALTGGATSAQEPGAGLPVRTIGVLVDGDFELDQQRLAPAMHKETLLGVQREIIALTRREFDVRFPDEKLHQGRWDAERIRTSFETLLADPEVDLILTMGVLSAHVAGTRGGLPKPVVAPYVIDPELQGFPVQGEASGVPNLSYIATPGNLYLDLKRFQELIGFKRVHVLHDPITAEVISTVYDFVRERTRAMGFESVPAPAVDTAAQAMASLPPETEAVYIVPMLRMPVTEYQKIIQGLRERKLPSFHILGRAEVERGILAAAAPETSLPRFTRRIALHVQRILLGEDAGKLPYLMKEGPRRLTINMETARAIDWYPNWRVALDAELINEEPETTGEALTIYQAVNEAIRANLDLQIEGHAVASGKERIDQARSTLLPQLQASTSGVQIDEDRAAASLGSQPERAWTGSLSLTQLLYSDGARAGLEIERELQQARELVYEVRRLDIAQESSSAFLNLLRAQALERIERSNLRLTVSNLDLARRRQSIGVTGPAEVYRWESQAATDRGAVLEAQARVNAARAALNRVLHRPQESRLEAVEPSVADRIWVVSDPRMNRFIDNEKAYAGFRDFLVQDGLRRTPELIALDAAIRAQERSLLAARRSFYSPDVSFQGNWSRLLSEDGEGTEGSDLSAAAQLPIPPFPEADDTSWSLGVNLSLPLVTGGERGARVRETAETLARLRLEREAAAERIELRIRDALFAAGSSFPAMDLTRESALAARKNLELVTDQYAQGVVSIIDLLDAQNAALASEQAASNAVYDFLLDLVEVQRAAATLDFFQGRADRDAWFERLQEFMAAREGKQ